MRRLIDIYFVAVYNLGMRRSDREVTELSDIVSIFEKCDVCRIALSDGEVPYIVPLNFGMTVSDKKITLFFHSATEGKKLELIRKNPRVCFELDCDHKLYSDEKKGYCTMEYKSVIGYGSIRFIENEDEKLRALQAIIDKYHLNGFEFGRAAVPHTTVYALDVDTVTAKSNKKS